MTLPTFFFFFYFRVKIGKYNSSIIINYYDSSIVGMIVKWLTWDAMACFSGCWKKVCACIVYQYRHKKFNGTQSVYSWHYRQQQRLTNIYFFSAYCTNIDHPLIPGYGTRTPECMVTQKYCDQHTLVCWLHTSEHQASIIFCACFFILTLMDIHISGTTTFD